MRYKKFKDSFDFVPANLHPMRTRWQSMMNRCHNPNFTCYKEYGGRGIKVCKRWQNFWAYVHDIGVPPTTSHTIERINNDGHYEPLNCRWATRAEQNLNKRKPEYCLNGHPRTEENTEEVFNKSEKRSYGRCKECYKDGLKRSKVKWAEKKKLGDK